MFERGFKVSLLLYLAMNPNLPLQFVGQREFWSLHISHCQPSVYVTKPEYVSVSVSEDCICCCDVADVDADVPAPVTPADDVLVAFKNLLICDDIYPNDAPISVIRLS